jgi:hypothetical protein
MINATGHLDPKWVVEEYFDLKYNQDTVDNTYLNNFLDAGHNRDQMCLYNYFEPNPMPTSVAYIKSHFLELQNLTAAINLVKPGQYMPYHSDLYARWCHIHKHNNINTIVRIIVMLENAELGQMLSINEATYTNWKAGDWFSWSGTTSHAIYNMSLKNRYAVQLTGNL